jgi:transcriptional regulator with XRE-family HTH domain
MKQKVFENIKKIRELKNITRKYVAGELGMSNSGFGKIERGEVDLNVSKLIQIANVLDVSVDFIFRFDVDLFIKDNKKSSS